MYRANQPDPRQVQTLIATLDGVLAELDRAQLGLAAIDVASAIIKLQRLQDPAPQPAIYTLRSTA
ncbi:hypothetical protein [Novosphingobium terrae]|jgi:hypothetical protein|uniref:hypothetical protein n=1 Tax=Novosphingobium terrae TaxID=2726189 RepID=UPI00197D15A8|nr:hypothetical protein [Novosphingobium terrae]